MKICLVSDTMDSRAGTEHSVVMAAVSLAARGHAVHLLAYCLDGPVHPVWQAHLRTGRVTLHAMPPGDGALSDIGNTLRALAPDIVHAIPMESLAQRFVAIARTVPGAAIIGTMTSDPGLQNFWYADLSSQNLVQYDLILSPSARLARRLVCTRGAQIRTAVVPHIVPEPDPPVSSGHWTLSKQRLASRDHLGAITRLREEKGPDFLLSSLAMIARQRPDAHLTIYGELLELTRSQNVAMALGVEDRITWHGPFDGPAQIDEIVQEHCLFLLPSLFESMPISLIEVLSRGRLCVAFDVGAVHELFDLVPGGRAVPVADPRAMADAALCLLGRPDGEITQIGQKAIEACQTHFAPQIAIASLESAYAQARVRA